MSIIFAEKVIVSTPKENKGVSDKDAPSVVKREKKRRQKEENQKEEEV